MIGADTAGGAIDGDAVATAIGATAIGVATEAADTAIVAVTQAGPTLAVRASPPLIEVVVMCVTLTAVACIAAELARLEGHADSTEPAGLAA